MNKSPTYKQVAMEELWELCKEFIEEQEISCSEAVFQTDHVIENAYDFITKICEIVGYHKYEDEDND